MTCSEWTPSGIVNALLGLLFVLWFTGFLDGVREWLDEREKRRR